MTSTLFCATVVVMFVSMAVAIRAADCRAERKPFWGSKQSDVNSGAKFG